MPRLSDPRVIVISDIKTLLSFIDMELKETNIANQKYIDDQVEAITKKLKGLSK